MTDVVDTVEPSPAATVVLVRESAAGIEVLMLLRNARLAFNGGRWVFPGGRIDDEDYDCCPDRLEFHAARQAAVRETREEAGIAIEGNELIHTAHWTTPSGLPKRFSTWFFLCPLYQPVDVSIDQGEILDFRWISPVGVLRAAEEGSMKLPRPTTVTLNDLTEYSSIDELLRGISRQEIRVFPDNSTYYRPLEMGVD